MMMHSQQDKISEYVIVEFYEERRNNSFPISIISSNWIFESQGILKCYWPTYFYRDKQREIAVKEHHDIDTDRSLECAIRVKYNTEDYENAEKKLKEIENQLATSASASDNEEAQAVGKRITKKRHLDDFYSDHSTDDEVIPIPPKIRKDSQKNKKSPRHHGSEQSQASGSGILRELSQPRLTLRKPLFSSQSPSKRSPRPHGGEQSQASGSGILRELSQPRITLRKPLFSSQSPCTQNQIVSSPIITNEENFNLQEIPPIITPKSRNISISAENEIKERLKINEGILKDILRRVLRMEQNITHLCERAQNVPEGENNVIELRFELETLTTLEQLEEFDRNLQDIQFFSKVVNSLGILGGKNKDEVCRNILSKILSKNLSLQLNWTGRQQKAAFSKFMNINKAILVAVRKNKDSENASQKDIETTIKVWLRNMYERGVRREQRRATE